MFTSFPGFPGFPDFHGFLDFHGESIKAQYKLYVESLKPREDDIESITECLEKVNITEKPKNPPTNLAVTGIYFLTPNGVYYERKDWRIIR